MHDEVIEELANEVVAARDFCGDEKAALEEAISEIPGLHPTRDLIDKVNRRANEIWSGFQSQAGVKAPMSDEERRQIYRDLGVDI